MDINVGDESDLKIPDKVLKYESFVNDVLKEELKRTHEELDRVHAEIAEYIQLKCFIETSINAGLIQEGIKSQVDIGCNFYIQANVDNPSRIYLSVGLGYFVEYSLSEALIVINNRVSLLNKKSEIYKKQSANTKAHIKLVLLGLKELQNLNMDHKKSPNRTKRQAKVLEDNYWDCSVCTYRNTAEAFKCLMCDIRKGTSTRKPRINPQLVAQQVAQQYNPAPSKTLKKEERKEKSLKRRSAHDSKGKKNWHPPRLKNVDRSTAQTREVTVNNVTVVITEYKPKKKKPTDAQSTASSEGHHSDTSSDSRSGDIATDSRSS